MIKEFILPYLLAGLTIVAGATVLEIFCANAESLHSLIFVGV